MLGYIKEICDIFHCKCNYFRFVSETECYSLLLQQKVLKGLTLNIWVDPQQTVIIHLVCRD